MLGRACFIIIPAWTLQPCCLFSSQNLLWSFILLPGPGQWFLQNSMAYGGTQDTSPTTLKAKELFITYIYTKIPALFYTFIVIIR